MITIPHFATQNEIENLLRASLPKPEHYYSGSINVPFIIEHNIGFESVSHDRIYNGFFEKTRDEKTGVIYWKYDGYK